MSDPTLASAEAAARAHAEAVVSNNIGAVVLGMTADGFAKAMDIGNTTWGYLGFDLVPHGQDGEDFLFDITYLTDQGPFTLRDRFRVIDGEWKVVDLEKVG
jgi:hypothetical protein